MRKIFVATCLLALLALTSNASAAVDAEVGIEVYVTQTWPTSKAACHHFNVRIINRGNMCKFKINAKAESHYYRDNSVNIFQKTIELPPGESTVEVFPVTQNANNIRFTFEVDGSRRRKLASYHAVVSSSGYSHYSSSNNFCIYVIGNGKSEVRDGVDLLDDSDITSKVKHPKELPSVWQGYLGLQTIIVLEDKALAFITPSQQQALSRWVQFSGGTLWIHGPEREAVAAKLQLPLGSSKNNVYRSMTGRVRLLNTMQLAQTIEIVGSNKLKASRWTSSLQNVSGNNTYYNSRSSIFEELFEKLHTIPRTSYFVISLLLGILIGPINFLLLRRRKKLAWFYLTAPVLALSGMIILFLYSLVHDGITPKMNERALMLHDPANNNGVLLHARAVYAPLAPSSINYSAEDAVLSFVPHRSGPDNTSYTANWDTSQNLTGSWVTSRSPSGIFSLTPVQPRMGISVTPLADGNFEVENSLTGTAKRVWFKHVDEYGINSTYYFDSPLTPGEKRIIRGREQTKRPRLPNTGILSAQSLDWAVMAEVGHLPHMVDGGLKGDVLSKHYYYIGIAVGDTSDDTF